MQSVIQEKSAKKDEVAIVAPWKARLAIVATSKTARLDDFNLYCTVRKIGDQIYEIAKKHGCWASDRPTNRSHQYVDQTADGLFIELYEGSVQSLWTPWGTWAFKGGSRSRKNRDKAWKEVAELLGATLYLTPKEITSKGEFGPVFAITKCGDRSLPKAAELNPHNYDSAEAVNAAWDELTARYQSQNNG